MIVVADRLVVIEGLALLTVRGSQEETAGPLFESPEYEALNPKEPVEL